MGSFIADLYTPVLLIGVFFLSAKTGQFRRFLPAVLLAEGLMFAFSMLEYRLGLWHSWGLDFSTHTAVLLPLIQLAVMLFLLALQQPERLQAALPRFSLVRLRLGLLIALLLVLGSALAYGHLMQQLDYHTLGDMLTTVISSYPLVWISFFLLKQPRQTGEPAETGP